ncbi:uncharacterized protein Rv2082-like [Zingiber officinale]|uniref:uncharacterized protein Rv2082-like n=1 Tax=Zingiber officinale TaxID=94328 RepID=UPI001C4B374C|nr:uncharacterized protein Rv2082-like [Zingiber officinale]
MPAAAYPTPPPAAPTAYPTPPSPVPATTYPTPAPAIPVIPYPVLPPTVPPAAPTYIDPTVPPAVSAPAYAAPGVPSPAHPAIPPIVSAPMVPPVPTTILSHPTDMIAAQARIPALAESMKSRFTLFRRETDPSVAQSWIETMERAFFYITCFEWEKVELTAFHLRDEADIWWDTQRSIIELVAEDRYRMLQFVQGLDGHIQVKIAGFGNSSYIEALDRALMIESTQQRANMDKDRKQTDRISGQT